MIRPLILFALIFFPAKWLIEGFRDGHYGSAALWFVAVWALLGVFVVAEKRWDKRDA